MIVIYPAYDKHNRLLYAANVGIRYLDNGRFETTKFRWNLNQSKAGNLSELERYVIDTQFVHGAMITVLVVASGYYVPGYVYDTADIVLFHRHDNTYLILKDEFDDKVDETLYNGTQINNRLFFYNYGRYPEIPKEPK